MRDLDFVMDVAPDWNPINRVIADSGCYEPNVTRELVKCLHAGMTFVDCGANIGYFTLLACSLGAHVWSFEPNSRNVWLLLRNLKINSFHAEVYPSALAERERILVYSSIEGNGQVEELGSQLIGDSQEIVRTVVLDKVLEGVSVDVMKIDIEGAEAVALMGASGVLEKLPTIFLEFSPTNIENVSKVEALTFLDGLIQSGYRAEIITDEGLESHPPQDICDIAMQSQGCFVDLKLTANRHGTA
jgi:FkbM family methyltransferase